LPAGTPRFVVLDVETTGLSASSHRIVELALLTTDPSGRVLDEWSTRLNPQGPVGATHIHGITDAEVAHAPSFSDVLAELNQRLAGAAVVAHNARFDLAFIRAEYARARWQLPHVPALCTLDASAHHLPHLARRRLADCCHAIGQPLTDAHSALGDARATAGLLAHYLHPHLGVPARPEHLRMPHDALAVRWPDGPARDATLVNAARGTDPTTDRRELSERARRKIAELNLTAPRKAEPLVQLIERFSLADALDEGAPAGAMAYLEKLAEVLEDGVLTPEEAADLREVAAVHDLDHADVTATHRAFVLSMAHAALADGKVTRAETEELRAVAALFDVEPELVRSLIDAAEAARHARLSAGLSPLPRDWAHGEPLRVGDKVVFTGCEDAGRDALEQRSTDLGVRVMNNVSSKTAMLVTDGTMHGGKHEKATALGVRMVEPATYRRLLEHLQPHAKSAAEPVATASNSTSPTVRATGSASPGAATDEAAVAPRTAPTAATVSAATVRAWGRDNGWNLGQRGRLPADLQDAYAAAHAD
jgi:DNA polymerase-3 subunit epsilon